MRVWYQNNSIWQETASLSEALGLSSFVKGCIAVIGSGGKTSTIFRLAEEFAARDLRVVITTTTRMFREPGELATTIEEVRELLKRQSIVIAGRPAEAGKIAGLEEEQARELVRIADIVLVEADGSKRLPLKVPASHEPVIPDDVDKIILVAGLSGIGTRLSGCCHRTELAGELLEVSSEHIIRPMDIAGMLKKGYLEQQLAGRGQVRVLLNQADHIGFRKAGEEIADIMAPYPCVIGKLKEE